MANENFKKAIKILSQRQQKAKQDAEFRRQELYSKLPRINELHQLMAQTSFQLTKTVFADNIDVMNTINKLKEKNLSIQSEITSLLTQHGYPKDYLETHNMCGNCDDSGYVDGVKCRCLKELITELNVASFNQTTQTLPCSFQKFSLTYYSEIPDERTKTSPRKTMSEILAFCKRYADSFHVNSPSILMMGGTGLGKTHLSLGIADVIMHKGFVALYISALDLFRILQNEYFGKAEPNSNTMQTVLEADLLIIDDLGAEYDSQFNTASLYNIINSRLNANKPTIINTNLMLSELESRYTSRVLSRLMTLYNCLKFVGKDIRQIKLKQNER